MRPVAVLSIGKTAFGAFPDRDLRSLAVEAIHHALLDAGIGASAVESFYFGNFAGPSFTGQNHLAPYIGTAAGFGSIPCTRIENACASSGSAFFSRMAKRRRRTLRHGGGGRGGKDDFTAHSARHRDSGGRR